MKLVSLVLFRWFPNKKPILISNHFELSSFGFFERGSVKELALFVSREVVERSQQGQRQSVKHSEHICHSFVSQNCIAGAILSDSEYPPRVAFGLISKALEELEKEIGKNIEKIEKDAFLSIPTLDTLVTKAQQPSEVDSMLKVQKVKRTESFKIYNFRDPGIRRN
jgi:synaptobrevin family protein YKT6